MHLFLQAPLGWRWRTCLRILVVVTASAVSSFTIPVQRHQQSLHMRSPIETITSPPSTRVFAEKAQVRFSGDLSTNNNSDNPVDAFLSWIISDVGSIIIGSIGLFALLVGRLSMMMSGDEQLLPDPAETRENLLVVLAIGGVLLNGLSQLDVESATAAAVELEGTMTTPPKGSTDETMAWVLQSVLLQDPVCSAVLLEKQDLDWTIVTGAGVLPSRQSPPVAPTLLLDKAVAEIALQETSLPNLQALPSKQELVSVLPANTQSAVLIPCRNEKDGSPYLLVLGSNRARSFTPKDIAWCKAAASRL